MQLTIHTLRDENGKPIAVQIPYKEWIKHEKELSAQQANTIHHQISQAEKQSIEDGLAAIARGDVTPHEDFLKELNG